MEVSLVLSNLLLAPLPPCTAPSPALCTQTSEIADCPACLLICLALLPHHTVQASICDCFSD